MSIGIGYVGQNKHLGLTTGHTTRVKHYNHERWITAVQNNFSDLIMMLNYNIENGIRCFRISSGMIPLATHQVLESDWKQITAEYFQHIGKMATEHQLRLSFHPDHFVVLNSLREDVVKNSIQELIYHAEMIEAIGLADMKMQIHVGGVFNDRQKSIRRFIEVYQSLPDIVKRYLVIENDDYSYSVADCMQIHQATGVPVLFDNLHHECLNNGEDMRETALNCFSTWGDMIPLVDYSSQQPSARKGNHAQTLNDVHFMQYINRLSDQTFDIMLEIKDKDISAVRAVSLLN